MRAADDLLLERSLRYCEWLTKNKARSFYFSARFLPTEKRRAAFALYAFCRTVDDIADLPAAGCLPSETVAHLNEWQHWLTQGAAPDPSNPVKYALSHVVQAYSLPLTVLVELLDGLRDDVTPRHLNSDDELERYCYAVAGTVGIAMAVLLGAGDEEALQRACDLGIAMQITNVLRDLGEDADRGRIYLPAEVMKSYGYSGDDLRRGVRDERFETMMHRYIGLAKRYYASGIAGIAHLPRDSRFPIVLAAHTYAGILGKIERADCDVFSRRLSTRRRDKILLAARLYAGHAVAR